MSCDLHLVSILRKVGAMQYVPRIGTPLPLHKNDINLYHDAISVQGHNGGGGNDLHYFLYPLGY